MRLDVIYGKLIQIAFLVAVICLAGQTAHARGQYEFEVGLAGLPSQKEGNILRDNEGFLWFCYYGGVGRYDGREVKYFEPGKDSISGPASTSIVQDSEGLLWILTKDNGLNSYDKSTDTFTHFKHDPNNTNSLSSDISDSFCPQRLFVDQQDRLLIGTMGGLDIYDKTTGTFTHYVHDPDNPNSISSNNVTAVIQGKDGIIWVGTAGGGLNRFNEKTNVWTRFKYKAESNKGPAGNTIWSLLEDRDGTLWVGTWDSGLSRFDKESETFFHFQNDPDDPSSLGDNKIFYLYEDSAGTIWICHKDSEVAGIEHLNDEKTGFIRYSADPEDPASISTNYVSTVYEDPVTGIFWVNNTNAEFFDKHDRESRKFKLYRHDPSNPGSLSNSMVLVMNEDSQDRLWLAVVEGMNRYDKESDSFVHYPFSEVGPKMGNLTIAMSRDGDDMWMLSYRGVLTKFDTKSGKPLQQYTHDPEDPDSMMVLTSAGASIEQDRDDPDILWISLSGGLEKFSKKTGKFRHFVHDPKDPTSITRGTVWYAYDDGKGHIWASTFGGLNKFDKETEKFTRYVHDPKNPDSIGFNKNSRVFEDSFGNFWVAGFANGMDLLDRKTGKFKHFNKENGFPAIGINQTIQEDDSGHLWLGATDVGLIKFDIKQQKVVALYTKSDGLQDNHFWRSHKTRDGQMWFGGGFGVNSFYPDEVKENPTVPPIVLTAFTQSGRKVNLGVAPELVKEVTLDWQENYFEFKFAALNYTKSEKNRFAYKLDGRDKDWYYSDNPSGRYTGLDSGTYTLRLKGSNNDGVWNEEGISIRIIVKPPFWKTGWFYTLLFVGFIAINAIALMYLRSLRHEIKERKLAQTEIERLRNYLFNIINSMPSILIGVDKDGRVTQWNMSAEENTGTSADAALGQPLVDVMPRMRSAMPSLVDSIALRIPKREQKVPRQVDGETRYEDVTIYPLITDVAEGAVVRIDDVTERIHLEQMMVQSEKMMSVGGLAAGMAHEINNPLAAVIGYAYNVKKRMLGDLKKNSVVAEECGLSLDTLRMYLEKRGVTDMLEGISESGGRAAKIVSNMLNFSRKSEMEFGSYSLVELLDQTVELATNVYDMNKQYDFNRIEIVREYETGVPSVLCDGNEIQQVFLNLIKNGAEAMAEKDYGNEAPRFILRVKQIDQMAVVEVEDNGPGMPENIRKRILEPFYTTKPVGKGTGLGLSVSYFIVTEQHGGSLEVFSEQEQWTRFVVKFPINGEG